MQNIEFGVVTQKTIINVEEGYPLKTFAPVDENGAIANNGDAYGIVIDALGIGEVKQLVVMTAGCIDKICAEQHYGESYSAEAISALENIVIYDNHKIGGGGGGGDIYSALVDPNNNNIIKGSYAELKEHITNGIPYTIWIAYDNATVWKCATNVALRGNNVVFGVGAIEFIWTDYDRVNPYLD